MSKPDNTTAAWELVAILAGLVIVLSLPIYYFTVVKQQSDVVVSAPVSTFVGSTECRDCHNREYDNWEGSHHDLAMDVASDTSVLGDFNNIEITLHGVTSRFYKRDGKFLVFTNGPGGEMGEFEITHTFGWFPLQQYLVPFPGGRLQTLPIAWDDRDKRWFRVPPDEPVDPDDWMYWTNAAQNWNGMCAQCHSTNLKKNYDPETDSYNTTWSDIDVGCEACHGPGSRHVEWAATAEMARPQVRNFELEQQTSDIDSRELLELCAPCHSRRGSMGDVDHTESDLLDTFLPSLLSEGLYHADGQIMEEVYVYGSFIQSKMYRHDVRCSDCHDPHSIKLVREGNDLCLQCHRAAQYDTGEHHFHKQEGQAGEPILSEQGELLFEVGTGSQCIACHMPGQYFMGVDYRPDHSFRIPNPWLVATLGAPDACLRCHVDQDSQWSQKAVVDWYGPAHTSHYGTVLAAGRRGDVNAGRDLILLARDLLYPVNVRATALSLLAAYPGEQTLQALEIALMDEEALIRRTAVSVIMPPDAPMLARLLGPMLYDPIKTVRIEAASRLAGDMTRHLDAAQQEVFKLVLQEYEDAMEYSADFTSAQHNLANLYAELGRSQDAIDHYKAAIRIDKQFYPARVNLAMLYNKNNRNDLAVKLFRDILTDHPEMYEAAYSLGLLLVEMQDYQGALTYLEKASAGLPDRARIHYNLGLLYQYLQNPVKAEIELQAALSLDPQSLDFLYGLADHYLKRGLFEKARPVAESMAKIHPDNPIGNQMLDFIQQNSGQ